MLPPSRAVAPMRASLGRPVARVRAAWESGAVAHSGVKVSAAVLALFVQVALVRLMGTAEYGRYVLFVTYCSLLFVFAKSGLDVSVLRGSAVAYAQGDRRSLMSILRRGCLWAAGLSLGWTAIVSLLRLTPFGSRIIPALFSPIWVLAAVGSMTVLAVALSAFRGMRRVTSADAIDANVKPLAILVVVAMVRSLAPGMPDIGSLAFVVANVMSAGIVLVAVVVLLSRMEPAGLDVGARVRVISPTDASIFIANGLLAYGLFQLDTLIVGKYAGPDEVGAYNMACSFVRLVIFLPLIISAQLQPRLASLFHTGHIAEARALLGRGMKWGIIAACAGVVTLVVGGRWLLHLVSPRFVTAYWPLVVLSLAHLCNSIALILAGSLFMCGAQRLVVRAQIVGLAVCLPLYLILIPTLGALGASLAVLAGMVANLFALLRLGRAWESGAMSSTRLADANA
jgi:O-antigen/teichoic acid export membrane protein